MINLTSLRTKKDGFTIVELAIVIAVIGILALIVLVAYPGYQQRNRDSVRKSDVQQVAAALSAYALQKNNYIETGSGCGVSGNGNGWLSAGPSDLASYPRSIVACLQDAKVLPTTSFVDPSGCTWDSSASCGVAGVSPVKAYMKATCLTAGVKTTYVLTYLETQPANSTAIDNLCDTGTLQGFSGTMEDWGTRYGMNYYVVVK